MALTRRDHTTIELQAPMLAVRRAAKGADDHGRFELRLPGEPPMMVIIKHQEIDYIHHRPLHLALQEVSDEDVMRLDIPVVSIGTPDAVTNSLAMLVQPTDHVKLRGRMKDMPEHLEADVSGMQIGDSIHAGDLTLPAGVELMSAPEATIFIVQVQKVVTVEEAVPEGEAAAEEGAEAAEEGEEE
jgi:large subunit ribosomal protein L25